MSISFTEPLNMIPNKQLPDITDELKLVDLTKDLNPQTLKLVQDDAGRIYGVPFEAFSVGLAYNRALFKQAGLDPDKPPTTWEEVRQYAKQIHEKTGKAGYGQLTKDNTGGWMLTTMTYSMGGTVQSDDGKKSTFNDAPTKKALQLLKDMRWTDNTMGSNFLYNQEEIRQDFAAGKIGMVMQASDAYDMAVKNFGMKPADYGHGALPQDGGPHGTLTGGSIKMINPKASKNEIVAALKWIKATEFDKYTNEQLAVDDAKTAIADKGFVGRPGVTPLSQETYDQYNKWREPYNNVPVAQFAGLHRVDQVAEAPARAVQQGPGGLRPARPGRAAGADQEGRGHRQTAHRCRLEDRRAPGPVTHHGPVDPFRCPVPPGFAHLVPLRRAERRLLRTAPGADLPVLLLGPDRARAGAQLPEEQPGHHRPSGSGGPTSATC